MWVASWACPRPNVDAGAADAVEAEVGAAARVQKMTKKMAWVYLKK